MVPITKTVIYRFNILVKYQHDILVFTNYTGQLIRYGNVELIIVDGGGDKNEASPKFRVKMI